MSGASQVGVSGNLIATAHGMEIQEFGILEKGLVQFNTSQYI